jgi:transcription elongation factor GreA
MAVRLIVIGCLTCTAPWRGRVFPFRVFAAARELPARIRGTGSVSEELVTVSDTQVTWLTQEAYNRLKQELDELVDNRPVIAAKINASREEGDLKENGGYHAAREEQGQAEARIRHLQELLRNAKVGEAPANDGLAEPGKVLTIRYEGDDETEKFLLATREEGAEGALEVYSPESPLGKALLGAKEGETRSYELPNGNTQQVTLVKAVPYAG